jgi:hypothetical protein
VHCDKCLDWLVDRKRCAADWRPKLAALRARASAAAATLPPEVLSSALGEGASANALAETAGAAGALDYAACVRIRDALAAREASGGDESGVSSAPAPRGLFGRLTGAGGGAAREWDALVRAYDKESLHLPEAAQARTRTHAHAHVTATLAPVLSLIAHCASPSRAYRHAVFGAVHGL